MSISPYDTVAGPFCSQDLVEAYIGPPIIGALFNLIFCGIWMVEAHDYFRSTQFKKDSWKIKSVVASVLVLALLQSSFEFWLVYRYGCDQNRSIDYIFTPTPIDLINTAAVGLEGAIVQSYLALRAGRLISSLRYKIPFYFITFSAVFCGFWGSWAYWIISVLNNEGYDETSPVSEYNTTLVWLIGASIADLMVTGCLCITLGRKIGGFRKQTDSMLRSLIRLALASASYTAICATIPAILILAVNPESPLSGIANGFPVPLSSLYALSLLLNLNARDTIRARAESKKFGGTYTAYANSFNNRTQGQVSSIGGGGGMNQQLSDINHHSLNISFQIEQQIVAEDEKGIVDN